MIDMQLKYDNMHRNEIFNVLNCINNHVNLGINCMLSVHEDDCAINMRSSTIGIWRDWLKE